MSVSFTAGIYGFELKFTYSATTTSPAGAGELRFNNASPGSATAIYIDAEDRNSVDVSAIVAALNTNSSLLVIDENDPAVWALFTLGSVTDNTTNLTLAVTAIEAIGSFSGNISLCVAPKGATGSTGSVSAATVLQRLVERGDRDRQRQTDQAQSIKATEYIGNGYVRQIGQAPTQSRYLGNAGLVPGELVAPIGRGQAPTQSRYLGNAGLVPGELVAPIGRGQAPTRSRYLGNAGLIPGKLVAPIGRGQQYVIIHKKPVPFFTPETIEEPVFMMLVLTTLIVEIPTTFENGALNINGYYNYDFNFRLRDNDGRDYVDLDVLIVSQWQDPLDPVFASTSSNQTYHPTDPTAFGSATLERFSFASNVFSSDNGRDFFNHIKIDWYADARKFSYNSSSTGSAMDCVDGISGSYYYASFGPEFSYYYEKIIHACNGLTEVGESSGVIIDRNKQFRTYDIADSHVYRPFYSSLAGSAFGNLSVSITDLQLSYMRQVIKSWAYTGGVTWVAWFNVIEKKDTGYGSIPNKTYLIGFYGRSKSVQKVRIFARSEWAPTTLSPSFQYLSINEAFTKYAYTEYDYEKDVLSENINSLNFNLDTIVVEDFFSNELSRQLTFD